MINKYSIILSLMSLIVGFNVANGSMEEHILFVKIGIDTVFKIKLIVMHRKQKLAFLGLKVTQQS